MLSRVQRRELGLFDAVMLVMGGIIGVGIFYNPARVAQHFPDPVWFLGMWVLGGVLALAGALTFAELGASFPQAGGWYTFLREAWGGFTAFLFAFVVLCVVSCGACAVMAHIFVVNVVALVPSLGDVRGPVGLALGASLLVGVTLLALRGAKAGALLQNACMLLKLAAIAAVVVGAFAVFDARTAEPFTVPALTQAPVTPKLVFAAMLPVLFALGGWQHLCYIAPQVRDAQRTLPRAILIGVVGVVIVYLAINAGYLRLLGTDGIAGLPNFAQVAARRALGGVGGSLLQAAMAISALGVCIVTIIASPWLYVAMGKERLFFGAFARLSPRTGAPTLALCVQCAFCLAWWFAGTAGDIVDAVVYAEWIFHALVAAALLRLRATRKELPRPFASPLYPLAPIVYLALALGVVAWNVREVSLTGWGVLALGALLYLPWRWTVARAAR